MIFLLNQERVLTEVMELVKIEVQRELGVPRTAVSVEVTVEDGLLRPNFKIARGDYPLPDKDHAHEVFAAAWEGVSDELRIRAKGLADVRHAG